MVAPDPPGHADVAALESVQLGPVPASQGCPPDRGACELPAADNRQRLWREAGPGGQEVPLKLRRPRPEADAAVHVKEAQIAARASIWCRPDAPPPRPVLYLPPRSRSPSPLGSGRQGLYPQAREDSGSRSAADSGSCNAPPPEYHGPNVTDFAESTATFLPARPPPAGSPGPCLLEDGRPWDTQDLPASVLAHLGFGGRRGAAACGHPSRAAGVEQPPQPRGVAAGGQGAGVQVQGRGAIVRQLDPRRPHQVGGGEEGGPSCLENRRCNCRSLWWLRK